MGVKVSVRRRCFSFESRDACVLSVRSRMRESDAYSGPRWLRKCCMKTHTQCP